jgi:hypothetical protein
MLEMAKVHLYLPTDEGNNGILQLMILIKPELCPRSGCQIVQSGNKKNNTKGVGGRKAINKGAEGSNYILL